MVFCLPRGAKAAMESVHRRIEADNYSGGGCSRSSRIHERMRCRGEAAQEQWCRLNPAKKCITETGQTARTFESPSLLAKTGGWLASAAGPT